MAILNAISQDHLKRTLETVASNVQKLAERANVSKDLSIDEILAAAASKIHDQGVQIQELQSDVKGIKRPTDGLYLDNTLVARTLGVVQETDAGVTFQLVVAGQSGLDFSRENFSTKILRSNADHRTLLVKRAALASRTPAIRASGAK